MISKLCFPLIDWKRFNVMNLRLEASMIYTIAQYSHNTALTSSESRIVTVIFFMSSWLKDYFLPLRVPFANNSSANMLISRTFVERVYIFPHLYGWVLTHGTHCFQRQFLFPRCKLCSRYFNKKPKHASSCNHFASTSKRAHIYILRAIRAKAKFCEHLFWMGPFDTPTFDFDQRWVRFNFYVAIQVLETSSKSLVICSIPPPSRNENDRQVLRVQKNLTMLTAVCFSDRNN